MSKSWRYDEAETRKVGTMICTACRKPITTGSFRYRETESAFLPQHRECSADDPNWAKMDTGRKMAAEQEVQRRVEFAAFVDKWGLPDDLIEEYQS